MGRSDDTGLYDRFSAAARSRLVSRVEARGYRFKPGEWSDHALRNIKGPAPANAPMVALALVVTEDSMQPTTFSRPRRAELAQTQDHEMVSIYPFSDEEVDQLMNQFQ